MKEKKGGGRGGGGGERRRRPIFVSPRRSLTSAVTPINIHN
jgi:hypothetical protein